MGNKAGRVALVAAIVFMEGAVVLYFTAPFASAITVGSVGVVIDLAGILTLCFLKVRQPDKLSLDLSAPQYRSEKTLVCPFTFAQGDPPNVYVKFRRVFDVSTCSFSPHVGHPQYDALAYWLDESFFHFEVVPKTYLYQDLDQLRADWSEELELDPLDEVDWSMQSVPQIVKIRQYRKGPDLIQTVDGRALPSEKAAVEDSTIFIVQEGVHSTIDMPKWIFEDLEETNEERVAWIGGIELSDQGYYDALFFNFLTSAF